MFDWNALNPEALSKGANEVDRPALECAGYRILAVLRQVDRNSNSTGAHEVGHSWIAGLSRFSHFAGEVSARPEQAEAQRGWFHEADCLGQARALSSGFVAPMR